MFDGQFLGGISFKQNYRAAFFTDKPYLEAGDKVIMPPSALAHLASVRIKFPMLFKLHNKEINRVSHCGILEFVAEEGTIHMPYWMMQNLLLEEGNLVRVKNATLPKGTYVKLQPQTKDFLDISNPKAILETTLRNFSCLTSGDTIMVTYNSKRFCVDIIETKPASAISLIEADYEIDFVPPLDYEEPFISDMPAIGKDTPVEAKPESIFTPFVGGGKMLDGKPTTEHIQVGSTESSGPICQKYGKLVFNSSASSSSKGTQKITAKEEQPEPT